MQFLSTIIHDSDHEGESHVCEAKTPLDSAKKFIKQLNFEETLIFRGEEKNTSIVVFKSDVRNRADALKKIQTGEITHTEIKHTPLQKALMDKTFYLPIHCYQK